MSVKCIATSKLNLNVKVSGLGAGKTVVVSDKVSSDNKTFTANATATLTSQNSGASYNVVVTTQPSGQHCKVIDGNGTLNASTEIAVKCYDGTFKTFYVTGKVKGLASGQSLTLQNNGGDDLPISGNGGFVFATALFNHDKYNVVVSKQPTKQTCTVSNGSGKILGKTVSNIVVTCKANTAGDVVTVGGTLNGLNGGEVVIANSTVDVLKLTANGNFTFANSLLKGSSYFVYVKKQPAGQTCTVSKGSGTANANVGDVVVTCQKTPTAFSVGGSVSGLGSGKSVVLQNNGGDFITMTADGKFTFATKVAVGKTYAVSVKTQPAGQTCTVNNSSGTIANAVSNVTVVCSDNAPTTFSVGGSVSGLTKAMQAKSLSKLQARAAKALVLQNNGGDDLTMTADGKFTFATLIAKGGAYNVTVKSMPSNVNCTVNGGSGSNITANVSNVSVTCRSIATPVAPARPVPSLGDKALALLMVLLTAISVVFIRQRRWL